MSDPEIHPSDLGDHDPDAPWDPPETDEVAKARQDDDVLYPSLQTQFLAGRAAAAARDKDPDTQSASPPLEGLLSPTLSRVDIHLRPTEKDLNYDRRGPVACATCPLARWFATSIEASCHCMAFHVLTWATRAPGQIEYCDARELALQARASEASTT